MRVCKVEGCDRKHSAKGYCGRHREQVRLYGKILERTRSDPNEIIIKGNIAEIVLYNRRCQEVARTVIDTEDVEKVRGYKWHVNAQGYAATRPKKKVLKIQHIIMGINADYKNQIDHRDRDRLNNRKSNFRFCTQGDNAKNSTIPINNTSGFKGVSLHKNSKKWRARITLDDRLISLGVFKDKLDAARAYNEAALKYHGEFACLNKT
ncbi:MAG: HNH endonuclease [Deltaproteobacteria bacterium]|nr:HNH endonuclease [Deltaproteobacteria bacterium]MBW1848336.1 HNH endonuclease [Deltaproteobacteria bacterium]MBW2178813.1 HNH endonuclease [Deltaproteobacteria bacterium]MBW2364328.1 HNH endonuclease [Deltaproteobacteria bacterium]